MCLHIAGHNRTRAAALAGVSRATFFNALRRWRIRAPRANEKLTKTDLALIRELVSEGLSLRVVAEKFEVSATTVCRIAGTPARRC